MATQHSETASACLRTHLREGERLVWSGNPDPSAWFTRHDLLLVPFSLVWMGFFVFVFSDGLAQAGGIFVVFELMFLTMGAWFVAGRFALKRWRNRRTVYGLTNQRALIKEGRTFRDTPLRHATVRTERSRYSDRVSVWFGGPAPNAWASFAIYENTGMDAFVPSASRSFAFYDVAHADHLMRELSKAREAADA